MYTFEKMRQRQTSKLLEMQVAKNQCKYFEASKEKLGLSCKNFKHTCIERQKDVFTMLRENNMFTISM